MNLPKISIITPSYNQGQFIEQTILSVLNQHYPNLEYIIIDGGSTDHSVDIIKKYESHLKYWVSEKDRGQAHAINKGLTYCTGEIFNWINSDDYLAEGALFKIAKGFSNETTSIVAGVVQNFNEKGFTECSVNMNLSLEEYFEENSNYVYHQPGVWLRLDVMKVLGDFRIDYSYCFDQEYLLRYLLKNKVVHYIPEVVAYFRIHRDSKTSTQFKDFYWELNRVYKEFSKTNKHSKFGVLAKEKQKKFEWPLLQQWVGDNYKKRSSVFFVALGLISRDPLYRLNKSNVGWLKNILFGKRSQ